MMQRQFAPRRSVELLTGLTEEEAAIFGNLVQQIKKEQDVHRLTRIAVLSALAELPSHHLEAVVEKALSARPKPVSDNEDSYLGAPPGLPQPCSLCSHCDPEDSQKCVVIVKRLAKADNIHTVRDLLDSRGFAGQYTYLFAPVNLVGTPPKFRTLGFANVGFVSHDAACAFLRSFENDNEKGLQVLWSRIQDSDEHARQFSARIEEKQLEGTLHDLMGPWEFQAQPQAIRSVGHPIDGSWRMEGW
eukprot:CAMPEP_0204495000 /NCGR_PEP_ID=MMETSP0471-20130131/85509_1 /ASSEMBLY_ACC=CAM_ASM_000602 /TAXON_ID=2969 /ORGANISM="Oxyrrhis marina" /LENGTH=244 /DNA_ID=CAMNT_0051499231 /DNA_START=65 /DNA_END=799 /DNA_ORIENTATION=+